MLGLKVELKHAEKWKRYILDNDLIAKEYYYIKDKKYIYFPIKKKFVIDAKDQKEISIADKEFLKTTRKGTLKENLSEELTKEELTFVKTAHDIIGNIAILEIPQDLEKKEKLIAETLLKVNSNIKTVLKKAAIHEGVFRTQKMTYLAGIKTKETEYKENNVKLKLDVEKVYFSIRLGNERKRIMQLVKPHEEILVMFSGCAPYPIVLAKNTKARHITGIEINPDGHKYGQENLRLNKIHNVLLINDDVHHAIPNIYQKIIGLKSSILPSELPVILKEKPTILEIFLPDDGLKDDDIKILEQNIIKLKELGFEIVIHAPNRINKRWLIPDCDESVEILEKLGRICKKLFVSAIVHVMDGKKSFSANEEKNVIENAKRLEEYYDYFYFENSINGFCKKEEILRMARAAGFKNICIDVVHAYIVYEDTDKIKDLIIAIQKEFNTYFHIADHDKKTHTCELGVGFIDFGKILPLVNKGIIEVESKSYTDHTEMIRSHKYLNKFSGTKKYDRIIMPLPKTADEFLEDALAVSQKGTIIHFYDFLAEDKFEQAKDKIEKACKKNNIKYKILDVVKCGQHAPYVYRICVDFEIV